MRLLESPMITLYIHYKSGDTKKYIPMNMSSGEWNFFVAFVWHKVTGSESWGVRYGN